MLRLVRRRLSAPGTHCTVYQQLKGRHSGLASTALRCKLQYCRLANPHSDADWEAWEDYVRSSYELNTSKPYDEVPTTWFLPAFTAYLLLSSQVVTSSHEAFCLYTAVLFLKGLKVAEVSTNSRQLAHLFD